MLNELLKERNIPALLPKEEALEILQREEYGFLPENPTDISFAVKENLIPRFCTGNAELHRVTVSCTVRGKAFSFPFSAVLPTDGQRHPFFIHINFRDAVPDRYMPTEELIDNGFAVLSFCYKDISSDDGDFTDGLAGLLFEDGKRGPSAYGGNRPAFRLRLFQRFRLFRCGTRARHERGNRAGHLPRIPVLVLRKLSAIC